MDSMLEWEISLSDAEMAKQGFSAGYVRQMHKSSEALVKALGFRDAGEVRRIADKYRRRSK